MLDSALEHRLTVENMECSRDDELSVITYVVRNSKLFVKTGEDSIISGNTACTCAGTTTSIQLLIRTLQLVCLMDGS